MRRTLHCAAAPTVVCLSSSSFSTGWRAGRESATPYLYLLRKAHRKYSSKRGRGGVLLICLEDIFSFLFVSHMRTWTGVVKETFLKVYVLRKVSTRGARLSLGVSETGNLQTTNQQSA